MSRRQTVKEISTDTSETLDDWEKIIAAIRDDQLSSISNNVVMSSNILIRLCGEGQLELVQKMVERTCADVNCHTVVAGKTVWKENVVSYFTPLTAACWYGHVDIVKYLVQNTHADVNLPESNEWGYTPLIKACFNANESVSRYLLVEARDLNVNITDKRGNTALHYTISCSQGNGRTLLHKACIENDVDKVRQLLWYETTKARGYEINVQDNYGYTPLHYACFFGHNNIVVLLMQAEADATITHDLQKTPAQVAELRGRSELLKLLDIGDVLLIQNSNLRTSLSHYILILLTLHLMKQKMMRYKWCQLSRAYFR